MPFSCNYVVMWGVVFSQTSFPDSLFVPGKIFLRIESSSSAELVDPSSSPESNPSDIDGIFSQYGTGF